MATLVLETKGHYETKGWEVSANYLVVQNQQ